MPQPEEQCRTMRTPGMTAGTAGHGGNRPGRTRAARNTPPVKGAGHCFPEHSRTIFMNSSPVIVSFSTR